MAEPVIPKKAKLFIGILCGSDEILIKAEQKLTKKFGRIDSRSDFIPFNNSTYYKSIGPDLFRAFYSFKTLIPRESIAHIKLYTNRLEKSLSPRGKRSINIDPGYLTLSNVYLASCKEYFHRAYLSKGVYLENEYKYVGKEYIFWDWTYPDYKKNEYLAFFHNLRRIYKNQI